MKSLKKNLTEKIKANPESEVFFFDEARFGTHSKIGHGWFKKGSRTTASIKIAYKNFYLYGAVNPKSGERFELILPTVNTKCMNIFFEEMAQVMSDKEIIFIMDGAGGHKSNELKIPSNFQIIFLPPYSPELNPVERLWLHIKQNTIRNNIYHKLSALEDHVCEFINRLTLTEVASICNVSYMSN